MIGALEGIVNIKKLNAIILMVSGVGYQVYLTEKHLNKIREGDRIFLFTHTHVREDCLNLYGFNSQAELSMFEMLLCVSGIGPKTSMLIIDCGIDRIQQAVANADVGFFTNIPRLGKKNAQKVIIELKSKFTTGQELRLDNDENGETTILIEALTNMGFAKKEILDLLPKIPELKTLEEKIKFALKQISL